MSSVREKLQSFFQAYRRTELPNTQLTRASVLVPIFEKSQEPFFLLTQRTHDVEHHKGQISFPGGVVDKIDRTILQTALRETEEEIGIPSDRIEIVGVINDIVIPTGFVVTPVVGYIASLPQLKLNKGEVESVLEVPFSFFLQPANKRVVKMERLGELRDVFFFTFRKHEIWGATAAIIDSFLSSFSDLP
jgi:8-oxo-dGTP pyrophosphatase MutT (NUDIX family)